MAAARKISQVAALLREARSQVEQGHGDEALTVLLRAWEKARLPAVTALIEQIDAQLPVVLLSPQTEQQRRYLAWCERAKAKRAADVGPLLHEFEAVLAEQKTRAHFVRGRIRVLRTFPPDPRIGRFAARSFEANPYEHELGLLAKKNIDPAQTLRAIELREAQLRHVPKVDQAELADELLKLEDAVSGATFHPVAEAHPEGPGFESEAALLAAVYANPADEALRQIYADRLNERGDPRGEFITLQFQRAAGAQTVEGQKRELSLLRKHGADWLGALAPFVVKSEAQFAKGFASVVTCNVKRIYQARQSFDFAEWSTVKEIRFDKISFITTAMKSLEMAINVGEFGIETMLALETLPPLKGLTLHPTKGQSAGDPTTWPWVQRLRQLTHLRSLLLILPWSGTAPSLSVVEALAEVLPMSVTDLSVQRLVSPFADHEQRNREIEAALTSAPPHVRRFEIEGFAFERIDALWQRAHRRPRR
jgi:uncharacterized protein (TIGR02996 family)